jgi:serine/threonine protein kinase
MFSLGCIFYKMYGSMDSASPVTTSSPARQPNRSCSRTGNATTALVTWTISPPNVTPAHLEKDLLLRMIEVNPQTRITPEQALKHPYFEEEIDDAD